MAMTEEEKQTIVSAVLAVLRSESRDIAGLDTADSLDNLTSLPAQQGEKLVQAPLHLLAKPAAEAAAAAADAAAAANAAAQRAKSAAEIAETYKKASGDEDRYVRGALNTTNGTISESTQAETMVCQQYIGIPEGTSQIAVRLYSDKELSGNAVIAFYDKDHNYLYKENIVANKEIYISVATEDRYFRYQMPAEDVLEVRITADGWTLVESFNPQEIKDGLSSEKEARKTKDTELSAKIAAEQTAREGDIERIRQSTGISNIPIFDETKDYAVGDYVNYEGRILKFHRYHSAGPMIFAEVDSATVMDTRIVQQTGAGEDVVMSQAAVSRELARTSLARIDDIVESATINDGIELEPEAIVYVKDQRVFAARKGSEFSRYWVGDDAYMTSEGEIQKDKLYKFNGAVYCWDSVSESLVPSYSLLEAITPNQIRTGYSDDGVSVDLYHNDKSLWSDTIEPATKSSAGVMSAADKVVLDALALQASKSFISVDGMDFSLSDILEILKGHRPTRYAVKYETETSSYVCGIVDAYTSRDGRMFTEIYTGGCNLAVDYTGGTHDSSKIYQFMRQYRIFGSGTPAAGTWSAWRSCLSTEAMEELYAMGLDYKVYEDLEDGYIEVKLTGRDGGVVGGSTEIPFATPEKSGFMSREDKKKLDGIEEGADKTIIVQGHGTDEKAVMSQAAVTQADAELLLRIQGRSEDSMPYYDPFKYVLFQGSNYLTEFNDWLDGLHTTDGGGDPSKAGFFRVSLWGLLCEVKNFVINWERMKFHQIVEGTISIDSQGRLGLSEGFSILQRRYVDGVWSEWQTQDVSDEIKDTITDGIRTEYSENSVSLALLHGQSRLFGDAISAATQDKAGVMSAEDKKKLDEMRDTVVFTGATVNEETEMLMLNRVDEETLVLDEVSGTLPGGITMVSQLENDKGYLTGAVEEESIMLNND